MRVNFLFFDYCLSFSSAGRSRQAKAESQKCVSNLAKKWCLNSGQCLGVFLSASKVENLYLLTQMYLQNVLLYAKYWSTVRLMPDTEMVLHPSLFAMLCCQTKTGCRAKSHRYQRIAQLLDTSVKCTQESELCSRLDIPQAV